jgi:hypothetical protein
MKLLLNTYIKRPLLWDIILISLLCVGYKIIIFKFSLDVNLTKEAVISTISDLINTSISLAGFVLASLTIIVTFKDNLSQKKEVLINQTKEDLKKVVAIPETDKSGMALLFSSKHYGRIVGVFTWAVFIFLGMFLILSIIKLFIDLLPLNTYAYLCIAPIVLTTLTIFRSVLVLYKIIKLQLKKV